MEYFNIESAPAVRPRVARAASWQATVDQAIFCGLIGGLAWLPLRYGSNTLEAWGINAILFPGLLICYELSMFLPGRRHPVGLRAVAVPATLFVVIIAWTVAQMTPGMPSALTNPIWGLAADALGQPLAASISVDRDLTGLALLRLVTAASVFWLALQLGRDGARANHLVGAVAAIGAAYATLGLIAFKSGPLPWLEISDPNGRLSATFVNHNSYATYAGIGLLCTAGLVVRHYQGGTRDGDWRLRLASLIELTGGRGAMLVAAMFLTLAALLLTGSRGGIIATGVGLAVLAAITLLRRGRHDRRRPVVAILVPLGLAIATLLGFGTMITDTLGERGLADSNRLAVLVLTARSILDAPLLGFGYGTFADVFPLYRDQSISILGTWAQAHDSYVETLQGLGLGFGMLLIALLALLALRCLRGALRRQGRALAPQVATGATCLVGVHAVADFSLQIQAVALTFVAILGAGVAQAVSSRVEIGD